MKVVIYHYFPKNIAAPFKLIGSNALFLKYIDKTNLLKLVINVPLNHKNDLILTINVNFWKKL